MSNFWQPKILRNMMLASVYSLCAFGSCAEVRAKAPAVPTVTRVIFPADINVGILTLLDKNWPIAIDHPRGRPCGQARGSLMLAANRSLMITFLDNIEQHPDALNKVPPDAISVMDFRGTGVSDKLVAALCKVKNLLSVRRIDLEDTEVTDKTLTSLANLKNLETINLQSTNMKGATIIDFLRLPKLFALQISSNNLEHGSFDAVGQLLRVRHLNLARTGFDDAAALRIVKLKNLLRLVVSDNRQFTDKGLDALRALPHLQHLDLRATAVTAAGVQKWKTSKTLRTITINKGQFKAAEKGLIRSMKPIEFTVEDRRAHEQEDLFAPLK